jgi:hypothetical protein
LLNGARLRLIGINGVLLTVLKFRAHQNRHRHPPDKKSGLSSDTALYSHKYKKCDSRLMFFPEGIELRLCTQRLSQVK